MEAGRLCEEEECCEWGDLNNVITFCYVCDKNFIPNDEHDKDISNSFLYYYGSEKDVGDICYKCLKEL